MRCCSPSNGSAGSLRPLIRHCRRGGRRTRAVREALLRFPPTDSSVCYVFCATLFVARLTCDRSRDSPPSSTTVCVCVCGSSPPPPPLRLSHRFTPPRAPLAQETTFLIRPRTERNNEQTSGSSGRNPVVKSAVTCPLVSPPTHLSAFTYLPTYLPTMKTAKMRLFAADRHPLLLELVAHLGLKLSWNFMEMEGFPDTVELHLRESFLKVRTPIRSGSIDCRWGRRREGGREDLN